MLKIDNRHAMPKGLIEGRQVQQLLRNGEHIIQVCHTDTTVRVSRARSYSDCNCICIDRYVQE